MKVPEKIGCEDPVEGIHAAPLEQGPREALASCRRLELKISVYSEKPILLAITATPINTPPSSSGAIARLKNIRPTSRGLPGA
jgi:hypothetical protein